MNQFVQVNEIEANEQAVFLGENLLQDNKRIPEGEKIIICPKRNTNDGNYYYSQDAIDFIKFSREQETDCSIDLLSEEVKVLSLHSADIWVPVIWIAKNVVLPFVISLVANYIFDRMKGRENDQAQVDFTAIVGNGKKKKEIHYKGPAKEFKETFEKMDISKL